MLRTQNAHKWPNYVGVKCECNEEDSLPDFGECQGQPVEGCQVLAQGEGQPGLNDIPHLRTFRLGFLKGTGA